MDVSKLEFIANQEFWTILYILFPLLVITYLVAVVVGAFQAMTQINEQTLTFTPKLLVIILIFIFLGGSMFDRIVTMVQEIIKQAPNIF